MAKKDRVPTPPKRPVQAPKAYKSEHNPRRAQLIFIVLAAVIIIAAAAIGIGFIMSNSGGGGGDDGAIGDAGTCQLQTFEALEASHVQELPEGYEYNSVPATSGLHNSQTAIWNLYDQPVPQINYVHNMEHGGLVIQYGSEVSRRRRGRPCRLVPAGHARPRSSRRSARRWKSRTRRSPTRSSPPPGRT